MNGREEVAGMSKGHRPVGRTLITMVVASLATLLMGVASAQAKTVTAIVGFDGDDEMGAPANVVQGDTVVFAWEDGGHDMGLAGPEGTKVGEQDEGFRLERKLDRAGTYSFACSLHDDMEATFEVAPATGAPANTEKTYDEVDVVMDGDGDGGVAPRDVTIEVGQTVQWTSGGDASNVSVAGASGTARFGAPPFRHTFTGAGSFPYSTSHGNGTITVVAAGSMNDGIRLAPAGSTPAATVTVGPGNAFSPSAVTIDEGQVVQWNWAGGPHNVKFSDGSGLPVKSSGSGALKFYVPRETPYTYVCDLHSGMSGSVLVRDTGAAGPNEQPPAPDATVDDDGGSDGGDGSSTGTQSGGVTGLASATASVATAAQGGQAAGRDRTRPTIRRLSARFRRGRRANRLRLVPSEDVQLRVTLRRAGRSSDLLTRRALRLYMRRGQRSVKLPVMNISAGRYRLRIVAIDRAGNRSTPVTLTFAVRR